MHWGFRLGSEHHSSFMQQAIALGQVTTFAGGYHVVPGVSATFRAGNDVIQGQVLGTAAVLAGVVVAAKDFPTINRRNFPVPFGIATG